MLLIYILLSSLCVSCKHPIRVILGTLISTQKHSAEAMNQWSKDNVAQMKEQQAISQIYSKHRRRFPAELYLERNMTFASWRMTEYLCVWVCRCEERPPLRYYTNTHILCKKKKRRFKVGMCWMTNFPALLLFSFVSQLLWSPCLCERSLH